MNATEFETFSKFDVIETQNGASIRLTPTPAQEKIINRLKNLIYQKHSQPDFDCDDDNEYSNVPQNNFDF